MTIALFDFLDKALEEYSTDGLWAFPAFCASRDRIAKYEDLTEGDHRSQIGENQQWMCERV
jgi:hypothetical protein